MFDSVDESKLHPPPPRRAWISRPGLMATLAAANRLPVTLVAAPAGYGKSTAVTQWLASGQAPGSSAWLCLDSGDNDPTRLWTHLVAALERIGCSVDANAGEFVAMSAASMLTRVVPRVGEVLAARGEPVTLVLDDCHLLRAGDCTAQLDRLIERLPANAHVVLIARSDPALRLGRLRVAGTLAEIRSAHLAFTTEDTRAVLRTEGLVLSARSIDELVARTEGWPAAVYLAALSLRGRTEPEEFVRDLTGSNRFIADYLSEEVLSRQNGDVRDFILDMSVFDRFSAALGDFATAQASSARLIRELERTNLFLTQLDSGGTWFRFHHLFRSFARSALEAEKPERLIELHRRGSAWFEAHGQIDEAVRHALAAGEEVGAADLVQRNWARYFDAGRVATVRGWLQALAGSPIDRGAAISVTAAWIAALTGQRTELDRRLTMVESLPDAGPLPDGTCSLRSASALIRGLFGFDGPDRLLSEALVAVQLETDPASQWYAVAQVSLAHARYLCGDLTGTRAHAALSANAPAARITVRIFALSLLALCDLELGELGSAQTMSELAIRIVREHAMEEMPSSLVAFTAVGATRLATGDPEAAMSVLQAGLQARRRTPGLTPWPLIHHLIVTATAAARTNRRTLAGDLLTEAEQLASWPDQTMFSTRVRIARARAELSRPRRAELGEPLTPREAEVLRRLRGAQSLREIANDLYVSLNTVKTITASVYRKLGVHSRSEAVTTARERSLL